MPDGSPQQIAWFNDLCLRTTTAEIAATLLECRGQMDIVGMLPELRVPTLVIHAREDGVVPAEESRLLARHILGAQGNVWTEYMKTPSHVEYMAWPRALALAEMTWTPQARRSWEGFVGRLPPSLAWLGAWGVNYRRPRELGLP